MNPNFHFVLSTILAAIAFAWVFSSTRSRPRPQRVAFAILASLLTLPGATFAAY